MTPNYISVTPACANENEAAAPRGAAVSFGETAKDDCRAFEADFRIIVNNIIIS